MYAQGIFGAVSPTTGQPTWGSVPSVPTYGSNPGYVGDLQAKSGVGSLGDVESIEDQRGLTIPSDRINDAKVYGVLNGLGESTLTINGANVPIDTSGLGLWIAKSAIAAAAGYYVGTHLGPKGSHAGLVGALASAFAGPIGLAATAFYYGR